MGTGSAERCAAQAILIAASLALAAGCSSDSSDGDPASCPPGSATCASAGSAATAAGSGGLGASSGAGGAGGMQPTAGGGAGATAGASGAAGASGTAGASGAAGGAGSAGGLADAGAEQDGAIADAGEGDDAATGNDAGVDPPPFTPVYRVAVRIHAGDSALTDAQFTDVTAEVNLIWRSQAGVCFEFELVDHDELGPGFDIWYSPGVSSDPNGYYSGDNDIFSRDQPSLGAAPNPVQLPTARTTAHEFGHALGLQHQDFGDACPNGSGDLDCNDLLMRSGRRGFFLSDPEVERARSVAEDKALDDTTPLDCAPLVIER